MKIPKSQDEIDALVGKYLKPPKASEAENGRRSYAAPGASKLSDQEAVEGLLAEQGGKWAALYHGDRAGYASPSEADRSLFGKLMFYCGGDLEQAERITRGSGLVRAKWDEKRGGRSFLRYDLERARGAWDGESYTPRGAGGVLKLNQSGRGRGPGNPGNPGNRTRPITAADLMAMTFEPTRWVVPDVLPEGLSLLAGKPKKGKSWMALGMCEAVAVGGVAFGTRSVDQGDTLYLALEDNTKRLQKRLRKVLDGRAAPEKMHLHTAWPRLDEGGAEQLDEWLTEHPEARLVVIDTLAKIRKPAGGANIYAEDYAALELLLPLAAKHGVAIVVVHHLRKMAAADPMDEISSSTGLTAGVDGFLILRRTPGSKGPTLYVDGRDIEEPTEYALHWNMNTATWTIEGAAEEVHLSQERGDILLTLNRSPEPMTPKETADVMPGAKYNNVKYLMWAMLGDGQLVKDDKGRYSPTNPTHTPGNPTDPTNSTNPANPTNSTNSANPTSESVGAVSGLVDAPGPTNPTFVDTYAENGASVSGVSGVSGDGVYVHGPECDCDWCGE
jgi:hypothetical protein